MVPDDLFRAVSLQALGARVPREDAAGGIQGEDRVVEDAIHEQLVQVGVLSGTVVRGRGDRRSWPASGESGNGIELGGAKGSATQRNVGSDRVSRAAIRTRWTAAKPWLSAAAASVTSRGFRCPQLRTCSLGRWRAPWHLSCLISVS